MLIFLPIAVILPNGSPISGSDKIVDHLCLESAAVRALYPEGLRDDIKAFEVDMHQRLGATSRQYVYNQILTKERSNAVADLLTKHTSRIESIIYPTLFRMFVRQGIASVTKARKDENANISLQEVKCLYIMFMIVIIFPPLRSRVHSELTITHTLTLKPSHVLSLR